MDCPFCAIPTRHRARIVAESDLAFAIRDGYPVAPGHTLLIPFRHVASWFDATPAEQTALLALAAEIRTDLDRTDPPPDGYNLGINIGQAAGQTIPHLHLHLIPRHHHDITDPTGGVRLVIPDKGNYERPGHIPRSSVGSDAVGGDGDPE